MDHRIVCTKQLPINQPKTHAHIVEVGTGNDTGWQRKWTLADVLEAMKSLDSFHTISPSSRRRAEVDAVRCPDGCGKVIIRSRADAVRDNDLDYLPSCG